MSGVSRHGCSTIPQLIDRVSGRHANDAALLVGDIWASFADVAQAASGFMEVLAGHGVTQGDRVVIYLPNLPVARVIEQSLLTYGVVRVSVSHRLHARELTRIVRDSGARVVCCRHADLDAVESSLRDAGTDALAMGLDVDAAEIARLRDAHTGRPAASVQPDDIAMLMYSSGTTGAPKGVVVTHEMWIAQINNALAAMPQLGNTDVVVLGTPLPHFGGSIALDCMLEGVRTVLVDGFDPQHVLDTVTRHAATILPLVPALIPGVIDALRDTPSARASLRCVPYGGSAAPAEALRHAARALPGVLTQFYGLAEALAPLTVLTPEDHDRAALTPGEESDDMRLRLQSAGRWIPGIEHREHHGEIDVRGSVVTPGYWRSGQIVPATSDGWFATRDRGQTDAGGYLHVMGRSSDVIISGGFNISPREVELVIEQIDGIAEVAVIGLPDDRWGEGVHAFVALTDVSRSDPRLSNDELLESTVRTTCLAHIASYKKPLRVHRIQALPRNHFGKVDRAALRQHALSTATAFKETT